MAKVRIKVNATSGKSRGGTLIARQVRELRKSKLRGGKPMWQTKAQIDVHLLNKYGERRARTRSS